MDFLYFFALITEDALYIYGFLFLYMVRINRRNLHKKDLYDPDNHDSVITHLESDILECEVKWALGRTTTNKASGGD